MKSVWRLDIGRERLGDVLVVTLGGRLGTASAGGLIDTLVQAVDGGHRAIVLDLTGLDYMSSAGLIAIDAAAGRIRLAGGRLALCSACDPVRLVLEFGGVLADVPLEASRDAALDRLRREGPASL